MQAKKILKDLQYFSDKVVYFPKREIFMKQSLEGILNIEMTSLM